MKPSALLSLSVYGLCLSDKKLLAVKVAQHVWSNAVFVPLNRLHERKQHAFPWGSALLASLPR